MRELYEEIQEYYLLIEGLSKEPSSPIVANKYHNILSTKLNTYKATSSFAQPNLYHKNFSGAVHEVGWDNNHEADRLSTKEKVQTIHDAGHLHNHFIKHGTEVGDVVVNRPLDNTDKNKKTNKRSSIYKRFGFGDIDDNGMQFGHIKQHSYDHPDESKRGQKYLHPLEQHEIEDHGEKPSTGQSDNKVRHLSGVGDDYISHQTKLNNVVHSSWGGGEGKLDHESEEHEPHPNNKRDLKIAHSHHQDYLDKQKKNNNEKKFKTPAIDNLIAKLKYKKE